MMIQLCKLCNMHLIQMHTNLQVCIPRFFNRCTNAQCSQKHIPAIDEEAQHIIQTLEKAWKNPADVFPPLDR
eukprot:10095829-Ditylum_brightwellii.AAC.2